MPRKLKSDRVPPNPHAKHIRVTVRFSNLEMQKILERAFVYSNGNVSLFLRKAALNFKK